MKKNCIFMILGGTALVVLSFLLMYYEAGFDFIWFAILAVGILAITAGALILVIIYNRRSRRVHFKGEAYAKKPTVLTTPERDFLILLRSVVDTRRREVLMQVSLAAVIDKPNASYRNELFRIIDFCVVDAVTFEPLLLIELNDKSHMRDDRRLRDEKVSEICAAANLPLLTFTLSEATDARAVAARIKKYVK